jgi:hypothetical protein
VWVFNWEETCGQVRSDMLWCPIPVVFKGFVLCVSGGHLLVPLWVLPAPLVM